MAASRARTRLRRTFRYPSEDDEVQAMDEQEQESLIANLSAQNALQNIHFTRTLLLLPILATLPYAIQLFRPSSSVLMPVLSIKSLLSTAYLVWVLPPHVTGLAPLDAWTRKESVPALKLSMGRESPLEMVLPYLNLGLVAVLVLMGLVTGRGDGGFVWIGMGNLPAVIYVVALLAKVVMGSVDPDRELKALKYGYKGA